MTPVSQVELAQICGGNSFFASIKTWFNREVQKPRSIYKAIGQPYYQHSIAMSGISKYG